jgi:YVTN family beta-propeller protein
MSPRADILVLTLVGGDVAQAPVADYDFQDLVALFGQQPMPRYVLTALQPVGAATQVTVDYEARTSGGAIVLQSSVVSVPAGTAANTAFNVDLGAYEGPATRLRKVRVAPTTAQPVEASWQLAALLGLITHPSLRGMTSRLTLPFARGSDQLQLKLTAVDADQAPVEAYNFDEHFALFGRHPEATCPRYVLLARRDLPAATTLTVEYQAPNAPGSASQQVTLAAGILAGASFLLDLGGDEFKFSANAASGRRQYTQLVRLRSTPPVPEGTVADWWQVSALLGNLAKLLWVIGGERDAIRRELVRVKAQRRLNEAVGRSLDLVGYDLGIPRFPPQPYAYDPRAVALYHLDDQAGAVPAALDAMRIYGGSGHDAANPGVRAQAEVAGRFGTGFAFRDTNAVLEIPNHADFDLAVGDSFTLECFVKPDAQRQTAPGAWHVLSKHPNPAGPPQPGWALSIGEFGRGIPVNARLLLSDGNAAHQQMLFADADLSGAVFYHLAGVIDRSAKTASLYVNGVLQDSKAIDQLGALTNAEPVRIGRSSTVVYQGVIDEIRLSRVARTTFLPVLGESDDNYRRRLRLFERWTLPSLPDLQRILNEAVGDIGGDSQPLVLNDFNATLVGGQEEIIVDPVGLAPGVCMDAAGNERVQEADICGTPAGEITFDPLLLVEHNEPTRVTYTPLPSRPLLPGEAPPDPHKMQLVTMLRLQQLLALPEMPGGGERLVIDSAWDAQAPDLRAVGRALLLRHTSVSLAQLAALAQRAGFDYVCHQANPDEVYASVAPGEYVQMTVVGGTAVAANGFDLRVGETLDLQVQPALPADTLYRWLTIACGAGRAKFTTAIDRAKVTLQATAPGQLTVKVDATRRQRTISATRQLRVGPADLDDGQDIADDGTLGVDATVTNEADAFFDPSYLVTQDDPRVNYGTDINNRRMQASVAKRLLKLLDVLQGLGLAGQLAIVQAFVPTAADLRAAGRVLTIIHPGLSAARLAVLAHAVGFSYIRRQGNQVELRQGPEELVTISGAVAHVAENTQRTLTLSPRAGPQGITIAAGKVYVSNSSSDTVSEVDPATGRVLRALKAGWQPVASAVSPDAKRLFTADFASNTVTAIDLTTGVAQPIVVKRVPLAILHHPTLPRVYVACLNDDALVAIDTTTLTALPSMAVGHRPTGIALTPNGQEIWVVLDQDKKINVVGTGGFNSLATIALPDVPLNVAIAPDGARAYVTFPGAGFLCIIDVASRAILGQFPLTGAQPARAALAPDGSALFVIDVATMGKKMQLLATQAAAPFLLLRGEVHLGQTPLDVAADSQRVYAVDLGSDAVSVINPQPGAIGLADTWRLGSGRGEHLQWVLRQGGGANAALSSTTDGKTTLRAQHAGPLVVRAVYSLADNTDPYTFEIRLKPALEADPSLFIRKDQYDLIMNILNAFHPVGVEVITRAVRQRVVEIREGLLNAFPDYTYPNFRIRGPAPRRSKEPL